MITKEAIDKLKIENKSELYRLIQQKDNGEVLFLLRNLGHLPREFSGEYLTPLLLNKDARIRYLAVKNLGKLSNERYLDVISAVAKKDAISTVRREAVSSVGRMRSRKAIPFLIEMLDDPDPKVALQALRALLIFKSDSEIQFALRNLASHPNETIQYVIRKEFFPENQIRKQLLKHTESPDYMKNVVVHGDVREVLKLVPDESIHLTFTSPPYYNARDYSIYRSYKEYCKTPRTLTH